MWNFNGTLLSNHWVKGEIKKEIRQYLRANKNEITTYQNSYMLSAYIKKKKDLKQPNFTPQRIRELIELKIRRKEVKSRNKIENF